MAKLSEVQRLKKRVAELTALWHEAQKDARDEYDLRSKAEIDRHRYRAWAIAKFKWWVKLLASGEQPSLKWLLADTTALFNKCEPFSDTLPE